MPAWPDDVTDKQGRYTLPGLEPGPYTVYIQNTDEFTAPVKYGIQCAPDQTLDGVDFDLIEGGLLSGTVIEAQTGQPLPGMTIMLSQTATQTSGYMYWRQETDANGHYSFRLAPGQYHISGAFSVEHYAAGADVSQEAIEIADGQTVERIDFRLQPRPKLSGVVADEHGEPVANASVKQVLRGSSGVQSDQNGRFALPFAPERLPTEVLAQSEDASLVGRVVVTDGAEEVQVRLQPEATVTGRVVTPAGEGMPQVPVKAEYEPEQGDRGPAYPTLFTAPVASAVSDENGRFVLGLLPRDVAVKLTILGDRRPYLKSSDWPENVVLQPGETRDIGAAVIDIKGRSISGRVMDADRNLLPNCLVIDLFDDPYPFLFQGYTGSRTRTDQLGRFKLTGLPYHYPNLWATELHPYEATLLAMHPELPLFAADAVIDPDWGFEPNLVLEPLGKVKGRLLDPEGRPMADHEVALGVNHMLLEPVNPRYYRELYERGARFQQKTVTDADGNWVFEGLIGALKYAVSARPRGSYQTLFHERITPQPGKTIDLGDIDKNEPQ